MALAVVKSGEKPAPTLADRIAEARRAEVRPHNRVTELQAAFDSAITEKRYADADGLQAELNAAREALAIARGTTRGLTEGLAAVEAQRASDRQAADKVRLHEETQKLIGEAMAAERAGLDSIEEALAKMRACLGAARDAFAEALTWEQRVGQQRQRIMDARVRNGEFQHPAPRVVAPNAASVLAESKPVVIALMKWDGE